MALSDTSAQPRSWTGSRRWLSRALQVCGVSIRQAVTDGHRAGHGLMLDRSRALGDVVGALPKRLK